MAAPTDPLDALIESIASKSPIMLFDGAQQPVTALRDAETIALPGPKGTATFPRTALTRYRRPTAAADATDAAAFFDLQSLVLLYLFKDRPVADYVKEAQATPGAASISITIKNAVIQLLERTREAGDEVRQDGAVAKAPTTATAGDELVSPRPAKKARYTVNRDDLELCRKYMALHDPKQLNDRKRVLRGQKPNVRELCALVRPCELRRLSEHA